MFVVAATSAMIASADVVVVVSAKSRVSSLTTSQIAKIFLAKTSTFPDGSNVVPLDQTEGTAIRNEFYLNMTGKDPAQLKAYWSKIIFTGDGQPPRSVANNEGVKSAIANNKNAIGYIDRDSVDDRVKVVATPSN
jgi:ABC-type phosphate transport system substrate-binding protein